MWKNWSQNLGAKLLAFVIAVGMWLSVTNEIEFDKELVFPIEYVNQPAGLTAVEPLPDEATTRIRAKGKFLGYRLRDGFCKIDLSGNQIGVNAILITGGNLVLPGDVEVIRAEVTNPPSVVAEFDETVIRDVPIHAAVQGEPDSRFLQVGKTFVSPTVARVKGPRKLVDAITILPTQDIDMEGVKKTIRKRVRLETPENTMVEVTPEMVEVGITIEPAITRTIENVELAATLEEDSEYETMFLPNRIQVEITGARSIVEVAAKEITSLTLHADGWTPGRSVLSFLGVRGRDVVFVPHESLPLVVYPWATNGPTLGPVPQPGQKLPPALRGEAIGALPLPKHVEVIRVVPDRIAVTVRERSPEGDIASAPAP